MIGEDRERRTFMLAAIYGLWSIIGLAVSIPAAIYLLLPPKVRKDEEWSEAGSVTGLSQGEPVEVIFRRNRVDGWRILSEKTTAWAVKMSDGKVVAFAPQCTHLGCAYHWEDDKKQFLCPCHTSVFGIDGKVLAGPATRPLDRYDVKVENNKLLLGSIRESNEQG